MREFPQTQVSPTLIITIASRSCGIGDADEEPDIGEFDYDLLSGIVPFDSDALTALLDQLVGSGLVTSRGQPPDAGYTFKHALVQDTAYGSLLRGRRTEIHGQIAQALEAAEAEPEVNAYHFTEAGATERAIPRWQEAGKRALGRSAGAEATAQLQRGLELVRMLPETQERAQLEFDLLIALNPTVIMTKGMASDEPSYTREHSNFAEATGD